MNWVVFAIFAYLTLALQQGLMPLLEMRVGQEHITPQLVLILAAYVGLFAPRAATIGAWVVLGLLVDLTSGYELLDGKQQLTLIGPYTLGYLAGGYVVWQFRNMVYRRHPLSMGFLVVFCGVAVELVVVLIMTVRQTYDPLLDWSALPQLGLRGLALLYSGAVGAILAIGLLRLVALFRFTDTKRPTPRVY